MKKKITAIMIGLTLCLGMTGCGNGDIEPQTSDYGNKYIDLVIIYQDDILGTEVVYDKNTKVMYFIKQGGQFGITPIYNSDGTVKLYDGE